MFSLILEIFQVFCRIYGAVAFHSESKTLKIIYVQKCFLRIWKHYYN